MADQTMVQQPTLKSVPASLAARCDWGGLIVRVSGADDLKCLRDLEPERVAWVEVPLDLAERPEIDHFSVDVILSDPQAEASRLYRLARVRDASLPRLTIPSRPGVARAATVAMALHFPVRLLVVQPAPEQVRELRELLERYLHDTHAAVPVEPFHSALAALIHGAPSTLWDVMERDPAFVRREPPDPDLDSVPLALARLVEAGAECAACPVQQWCAGWFKWPDPTYDCGEVRVLFTEIETAARQLAADLDEAREAVP